MTPVEAKIRSFRSSQSRWSLITRSTEMFPKMFQKTAKMLPSFNTNKIGNSNVSKNVEVKVFSNLKQFKIRESTQAKPSIEIYRILNLISSLDMLFTQRFNDFFVKVCG